MRTTPDACDIPHSPFFLIRHTNTQRTTDDTTMTQAPTGNKAANHINEINAQVYACLIPASFRGIYSSVQLSSSLWDRWTKTQTKFHALLILRLLNIALCHFVLRDTSIFDWATELPMALKYITSYRPLLSTAMDRTAVC